MFLLQNDYLFEKLHLSQIKVVRFIGELVKFGLYSKMEALYCVKVLLHDFKHHHIEMACNLLETCGRYLYCNPDTHQRTMIYLQQMMRKKVGILSSFTNLNALIADFKQRFFLRDPF